MLQSSCKAALLSSLALLLTWALKTVFPIQMMRKSLHYLSDCYSNFLSYHVLRNNQLFVIVNVCERKLVHTIFNKQRHFSSSSHACKLLHSFILRRNCSGMTALTTTAWKNAASNRLCFFPVLTTWNWD